MANNYTGCAFALDLPSAEAAEYAVMTAKVHNLRCKGDPEPNEYAEIGAHGDEPNAYELEPFLKDGIRLPETIITEIGTSRYSIYVDAEDCDFEAVAAWLLHLVKMYDLPPIGFEWASWCSKPRVGEFGGGACWVMKTGAVWHNTGDWLRRMAATERTASAMRYMEAQYRADCKRED